MKRTKATKRTYKAVGSNATARATLIGENVVHVFVHDGIHADCHNSLSEFHMMGRFSETVKALQEKYGCAWERCPEYRFPY